jgi:hypothetical protein
MSQYATAINQALGAKSAATATPEVVTTGFGYFALYRNATKGTVHVGAQYTSPELANKAGQGGAGFDGTLLRLQFDQGKLVGAELVKCPS